MPEECQVFEIMRQLTLMYIIGYYRYIVYKNLHKRPFLMAYLQPIHGNAIEVWWVDLGSWVRIDNSTQVRLPRDVFALDADYFMVLSAGFFQRLVQAYTVCRS